MGQGWKINGMLRGGARSPAVFLTPKNPHENILLGEISPHLRRRCPGLSQGTRTNGQFFPRYECFAPRSHQPHSAASGAGPAQRRPTRTVSHSLPTPQPRRGGKTHLFLHAHPYTYTYIHICVFTYVYVKKYIYYIYTHT